MRLHLIVLAVPAAFAAGWIAHPSNIVSAAPEFTPSTVQLQGVGTDTQLAAYDPTQRRILIYRGVLNGSAEITCSYALQFDGPGDHLNRKNCGIQTSHH